MTFWSAPNLEPTRKHRFKVSLGGDFLWWAKSVTKPGYDIGTNKYTAINHSLEYPGILTWNDVTLTIVDVAEQARDLYDKLEDMGYKDPGRSGYGGIKKGFKSDLFIEQMNAEGNTIEKWTLSHFMIKSVTFGDLSYEDDGLVEIALTIAYDWAEFE